MTTKKRDPLANSISKFRAAARNCDQAHDRAITERNRIYGLMADCLTAEDIEDLAFRLGIDELNLNGQTTRTQIRALYKHCEDNCILPALMSTLREVRPNKPW